MNRTIKTIISTIKTIIIGLLIILVLDTIMNNVPRRVGHTNFYFLWCDDYRYLAFKDPITKRFSSRGHTVTCNEVYYDDNYILAYDLDFQYYCIIKLAKDENAFKSNNMLMFKDTVAFYKAIDSLGINTLKLQYVHVRNDNGREDHSIWE